MPYFVVAIQILSGVALTVLILLHAAKGEGLGGIGGSASLFSGPSQAEVGLNRITWVAAGFFMFTSALIGWKIIQF